MSHVEPFVFTDAPAARAEGRIAQIAAGLASTDALFQALYDALELPGYFGFTWGALSDCLRDFHWLDQRRIVLQHADLPAIPTPDLRTYLGVLAEAQATWKPAEEHWLIVVFPTAVRDEVARLTAPTAS